MASDPDLDYRALEYVGKGVPEGFTRWRTPEGVEVDVHPTTVLRQGLTGRLREALAEQTDYESEHGQTRGLRPPPKGRLPISSSLGKGQGLGRPGRRPRTADRPTSAKPALTTFDEVGPEGSEPVGGHNDEWRWDVVRDGEDEWLCIDNRPTIDRATAELREVPAIERARIPLDLLRVILG